MANVKISELNSLNKKAYNDVVPIVDVSTNETKKVSIEELVDNNVSLIAVDNVAPSECQEGDKYYNTTTNLIYTATYDDTWGTTGESAKEGILYIVFSEQKPYAYNGTTLVLVGGGANPQIVNSYSTSSTDGYSCDYVNGIIESGSNSNGNWIKYADGTMICYKTVQSDVDMTTEWGSGIYEGSQVLGNYAQEFLETPCVSITNGSINGGIVECFLVAPNKTSAGTVTYCRVGGTTRSIKTNIIAIGKWK